MTEHFYVVCINKPLQVPQHGSLTVLSLPLKMVSLMYERVSSTVVVRAGI